MLVEKILEPGERLEARWATAGTTGYDVLGLDRPSAHRPRGSGTADRPRGRTARAAVRLGADDPRHQARRRRRHPALGGTTGRPRGHGLDWRDRRGRLPRRCRRRARWRASRSTAPTSPTGASTSTRPSRTPGTAVPSWPRPSTSSPPSSAIPEQPAALRFQQTSGVVMAKGVEDCAFYRYLAPHLAHRGRRRPERASR